MAARKRSSPALASPPSPATRDGATRLALIASSRLGRPVSVTAMRRGAKVVSYLNGLLSVHPALLEAPLNVQQAVGAWLVRDASGEPLIRRYLGEQAAAARREVTPVAGSDPALLAMQQSLGRRYFKSWSPVAIRWGASIGRATTSIRLGYYEPDLQRITLNPIFRQPGVPREALERTLYHEMLHHDMPTTVSSGGRREVHSPEFRRREKLYAGYAASEAWRRDGMIKILQARLTRRS